jgi:hypothetical protein
MDDELNMSAFGENDDYEINYDFTPDDDDEKDDSDTELEKDKQAVDGEDQGEVDSEEDDQDEGKDDDDDDSGDDSSSNLYSSVTAILREQGLLPSLDIENTKIESVEDFAEAMKSEMTTQARAMAEQYLDNLDIESIAKSKAEINDLNSVTEESLASNLEQAKQIVYQDYLNQGLDKSKVDRLLNRLIDLGDDAIIEEAKDSLESLKEFNNRKIADERESYEKRVEEQRIEQETLDQNIKKAVFERNDLIKGYTPNKVTQEKVYKSMNDIVGKSPEGVFENKFMKDRRENPIDFETRMYMMYELTDGFKDFSKIAAKGKSSAVKDLENIVKKGGFKDAGAPAWMSDKNSYDIGIGDELNL